MNKINYAKPFLFLLFAFLNFISITSASSQGIWTKKADFSGTQSTTSFSIGNKGYIMGSTELWEHDPATNAWTKKANFPGTAGHDGVAVSIGNVAYFGVGANYEWWMYDQLTNTWTRKADWGGFRIWGAAGFALNGKVYVGTGVDSDGFPENIFQAYDTATNTWTAKANFGGGYRAWCFGMSINNKGYIGFGTSDMSKNDSIQKDWWEYDATANSWTKKANCGGNARIRTRGFAIGNFGFIGTGTSDNLLATGYLQDFWRYNQSNNTWSQMTDYPGSGRYKLQGFSIGTKGYLGLGENAGLKIDFYEYVPSSAGLVDHFSSDPEITLYPNPSNGDFTIISKTGNFEKTNYRIYSIFGKEIMIGVYKESSTEINLSDYPSGIYFVEINTGDKKRSFKLIKN